MSYDNGDVRKRVEELVKILGLDFPHRLQDKYECGKYPLLLSYDKVQEPLGERLTALEKYLISVSSFLNQPCHFYDIFRAGRHVPFFQLLSFAIKGLMARKIDGLDAKIELLRKTQDYDEFESLLFELVVAWRYFESGEISDLEFVPEDPKERTPDLFIARKDGTQTFCECKKLNRMSNFTIKLRNDVRDLLTPVINSLREERVSFLGEIDIFENPRYLSWQQIEHACRSAIQDSTPIIGKGFTISAKRMKRHDADIYQLYPSPEFLWNRYNFRERDEWFGIVHQMYGKFTDTIGDRGEEKKERSTWLDTVGWDAAIKWKVVNPSFDVPCEKWT